jgi:RNA polymerase sigma factor (TIGR02999 family)
MSSEPPRAPLAVTQLLGRIEGGDRAAFDQLFGLVYDDLRVLARKQLGRRAEDTLSTTVLVHEVYLKFSRAEQLSANDRHHFFSLAARAMRQVLLDHVRRRQAERRPDPARARSIDDVEIAVDAPIEELIAVETALSRLEQLDPDLGRLVEWRVFAGLTLEEIAEIAQVSVSTLKREWQKARAFLHRELAPA